MFVYTHTYDTAVQKNSLETVISTPVIPVISFRAWLLVLQPNLWKTWGSPKTHEKTWPEMEARVAGERPDDWKVRMNEELNGLRMTWKTLDTSHKHRIHAHMYR